MTSRENLPRSVGVLSNPRHRRNARNDVPIRSRLDRLRRKSHSLSDPNARVNPIILMTTRRLILAQAAQIIRLKK